MVRKYHNHKLQTHPWHREKEPHNNHETPGGQTKQSNQLSLTRQDDCKTKMDIKSIFGLIFERPLRTSFTVCGTLLEILSSLHFVTIMSSIYGEASYTVTVLISVVLICSH